MTTTHPALDTLDALAAAWDDGDADAYGEQFTEDATYVVFNGHLLRGRKEIADVHRGLFAGPLRGSRMTGPDGSAPAVESLREPAPGVVHAITVGAVAPEGAEPAGDRRSVVSFTLVETPQGWKVTAFQNTRRPDRG